MDKVTGADFIAGTAPAWWLSIIIAVAGCWYWSGDVVNDRDMYIIKHLDEL